MHLKTCEYCLIKWMKQEILCDIYVKRNEPLKNLD